jgi:enoyl-[acyl-carrier-protein] reductase (NADH)
MARPIPRAPPVTMADFPARETSSGEIMAPPARWTVRSGAPYRLAVRRFPDRFLAPALDSEGVAMTRLDDSPVPDYANRLRLDGRRFVCIGSGQGNGRQAAHALAANGARLLCVDVDPDLADDIAGEVGGIAWSGDATKREDVARMFDDAASELGGVDGVVDIVGISRFTDLLDLTDDDWNWHFDMSIRHAFLAMQYGAQAMAGHPGVMVFVASVSGISSAPRHAAYGAAKAGLMSLVRTGAVELGPRGIRVNAISAGPIRTLSASGIAGFSEILDHIASRAPLRRNITAEEVGETCAFLVGPMSSGITGSTLYVDAGSHAMGL